MPRILVVDDSAVMREMMINGVMEAGYGGSEFVEAADGAAGLERLRKKSVDLILSDLHMPNMDGIQFLQAVRAESIAVPFIIVTTDESKQNRQRASAAGADGYLIKPFTSDELAEKIRPFLGRVVASR